jgi:hypothetical protein
MPSHRKRPSFSRAGVVAALMLALMLAGALGWVIPYLRAPRPVVAGVPAPPPLFTASAFTLAAHEQACMSDVTVESNSRLAEFELRPARPGPAGGPPVRLVLRAHDYQASVNVPGGYPGGAATLPITPGPPARTVIASACFTNLGHAPVNLQGSTEPRTIAHSSTRVGGRAVAGDITLTFYDSPERSLLRHLGEVFSHASNLTEGLVPVWLIWAIVLLVAFGVPGGIAAAFYIALRGEVAINSPSS